MKTIIVLLAALILTTHVLADKPKDIAKYLQDISVTIKAESEYQKSEGSGVLITRKIGEENVTFVWTAAHVVDNLKSTREVVDSRGLTRKVVEFKDAQIVKELVDAGRRVGELKMDASVIKYSDADDGHDLALLLVRARDYGKASATFSKPDDVSHIVPISTKLYHVGSLLGQMGANSMTTGIVSQVGRTLGKVEYDQTTVTAFPGSSGGGVYTEDGVYVGMVVRGAGEGFNLIVPIRRMSRWATEHKIMWALDEKLPVPSIEEIKKLPVEATSSEKSSSSKGDKKSFPFLIRRYQLHTESLPTLDVRNLNGPAPSHRLFHPLK